MHQRAPAVVVVVAPCEDSSLRARARQQVRAQTYPSVQVQQATGEVPPDSLRRALTTTSAEWFLWFDPRDELAPGAIEAMAHAAGRSASGVGVARFVFWSPLGVLPGDPLAGHGAELGAGVFDRCCPVPPHAVLVRRRALSAALERCRDACAWDYQMWRALAAGGARWHLTRETLASCTLRAAAADGEVERELLSRAMLAGGGGSAWLDAAVLLRATREWVGACGEGALARETKFPEMFPRWWQRLAYCGEPPLHVLHANGGLTHAYARWPERLAEAMVEHALAIGGEIELVGLGRNGRHVARALVRRGLPVRGRDDRGLPAWAAEDGIDVHVTPVESDAAPGTVLLVTPWDDAGLAERLAPMPVPKLRWSTTPAWMAEGHARVLVAGARGEARPLVAGLHAGSAA